MVVGRKIPKLTLDDCERRKFDINDNDEVIIRTTAEGEFTFSGLGIGMKTSTLQLTSSQTALPATALTDRNSLTIQNFSPSSTVYIGTTGVTAGRNIGSTTDGYELGPEESVNIDFKAAITIYGICDSGETAIVKITEYA